MAAKFEVVQSGGEYRWVLTSQGRILATSESYSRKALAEKAITSFRMVAVNAPVVDMTLAPGTTATGQVARATGRTVAKAVVTSGRAVEKVQQAAAKAVEKVAGATTVTKRKKGSGKKGPGKKRKRR